MNPSKKTAEAIWNVYDAWLHAYLNADHQTYDSFFDDSYHFIGSTNNEEFLNRKDTARFFELTGELFSGLIDLRNETKIIEQFDELFFITHFCDVWFLNEEHWTYYGRFRLSSIMKHTDEGWRFLYQHFSMPDSKSEEGQSIGFDKVHLENQELREAIQRRTTELEQKNRELEIEGALERIRSQAIAMKASSDLLDIVVTMRHEFIKLGHDARYFWHMMWGPETYEKAMTSGDGSRIGFVMTLPRHIHGDIPLLAKWEKSKKPTVVYAMDVDEAIDYVDKMVQLGDFRNIDPQAPGHDDIRNIGGLTFIMARTTHGEIGYSLPGVVKHPPLEDLDILVQFASAFDLAHQRFLDLQKAEQQARETQIELSLERIRSRVTAMQQSSDLFDIVVSMRNEFISLGHEADYFWHMKWTKDNYQMSMTAEDGGRLGMVITVPKFVHDNIPTLATWEKSKKPTFVLALDADAAWDYIDNMNTHGQYQQVDPNAPTQEDIQHIGGITFVIARTTHGEIGFSIAGKVDHPPQASIDILARFASVFDLAYKRFEDLKYAEAQARETEIELALEKVRSRTMAMQKSEELSEASFLLDAQIRELGINTWGCAFNIYGEEESTEWFGNEKGELTTYTVPRTGIFKEYYDQGQKGETLLIKEFSGDECVAHYDFMSTLPGIGDVLKQLKKTNKGFPNYQIDHVVYFKFGYLLFITREPVPEAHDIFKRFAKVFEQTYTRFLDLKRAEEQTREAQINLAVERIRAKALAMHKSEEIMEVVAKLKKEVMGLEIEGVVAATIFLEAEDGRIRMWDLSALERTDQGYLAISDITFKLKKKDPHLYIKRVWENPKDYFIVVQDSKDLDRIIEFMYENNQLEVAREVEDYTRSTQLKELYHATQKLNNGKLCIDLLTAPPEEMETILNKMGAAFDLAYKRFEDIKRAEAQAREAQIEAALEKVRSRTMAMQKSEELPLAANNLFLQVQELGIPAWSAGYCIWEEDKHSASCNMSSEGEIQKGFILPSIGEGYDFYTPQKKGESFYVKELGGEALVQHYEFMKKLPKVGKILKELTNAGLELPKFQIFHICYFKYGYVMFITYETVPEAHTIFKRFGKVFEQTYTRFLDLQKAEAQAREAKIEAALERVRSQSISMQRSEELSTTTQVFHQQLQLLGIDSEFSYLWLPEEDEQHQVFWATWSRNGKNDKDYQTKKVRYPMDKSETSIAACYAAWESEEPVHVNEVKSIEVKDYFNTWAELLAGVDKFQPQLFQEGLYYIDAYMNYGCFGIMIKRSLNDNEKNILNRFSKEFQITYTRFLDLQRAEAQAREAQIEAALERVRSHSMGMQSTSDFAEVTTEMFTQLRNFGEDLFATGIVFCDKHEGHVEQWHSIPGGGMLSPMIVPIDLDYIHQYRYDQWKAGKELFSIEIPSDFIKQHFEDIFKLPSAQITLQDLESRNAPMPEPPPWEIDYGASFKHGYILISSLKPLENTDILTRFASVFEQAYTRYLDLKRVEVQAREAQIEAALERVRSRSLAMRNSEELGEVVKVLVEKLRELKIPVEDGVAIVTHIEGSKDQIEWMENPNSPSVLKIQQTYFDHPILNDYWKAKNTGLDFIAPRYSAKENQSFLKHIFKHTEYKNTSPEIKEYCLSAESYSYSAAFQKNSSIFINHYSGDVLTPIEIEVVKRFSKVFEQAYIRFLDLQKAEEQAREAKIEAALEKVRSRSLSMEQPNELNEVVQLIAEKLQELDVILDLGGVVICTYFPDSKDVLHWIATPDSESSGKFHLPYFDHIILKEAWASKNKGDQWFSKAYSIEEKNSFFEHAFEHSDYKHFPNEAKKDILNRKHHTLSFAWSKHSALLIPSYSGLMPSENEKDILIRFAKVFEHAYIRFMDLQDKEVQAKALLKEKKRLEETLSDLQTTQKQLIQSEKMASLGELTAGIAHEIQNPLNFVNNFSEVSKELIEEMREEMENGDMEEVKAIMKDVIQNLEKINYHGKRADGIVKGMLQHSRASNNKKEATDLNVLTDEYLRLAYHGLRAKDKSFNAELKTDFDASLKPQMVVPQDIGRVILNLLTNAFYIVHQKKQTAKSDYKPTVSVSTKQYKNNVEIKVSDNGNGMPDHIKDKIFQPFFTTKPTGEGTGLGLSLSYDIITKGHGGNLSVSTLPGEGSTFIITIPH